MQNKICVVTGGGRGIGRQIVNTLADAGAAMVIACDLDAAALEETVNGRANVRGQLLNVSDRNSMPAFVAAVVEEFGRIDVLVNNAGVTRDNLIQNMSEAEWDLVLDINLKGVFNLTQAIAPVMMAQGSGAIVSLSSVVGLDGNIGQSNYAASKGGVIALTKTWAKEFTRKGADSKPFAVDGLRNAEWVAMDYADVLVHVFLPETRAFYNLEHLWADAKLIQIPDLD